MEQHENECRHENNMTEVSCPHHWLIEPPQGPTSIGICKMCGAIKEFDNQYSAQAGRSPQAVSEKSEEERVV